MDAQLQYGSSKRLQNRRSQLIITKKGHDDAKQQGKSKRTPRSDTERLEEMETSLYSNNKIGKMEKDLVILLWKHLGFIKHIQLLIQL